MQNVTMIVESLNMQNRIKSSGFAVIGIVLVLLIIGIIAVSGVLSPKAKISEETKASRLAVFKVETHAASTILKYSCLQSREPKIPSSTENTVWPESFELANCGPGKSGDFLINAKLKTGSCVAKISKNGAEYEGEDCL